MHNVVLDEVYCIVVAFYWSFIGLRTKFVYFMIHGLISSKNYLIVIAKYLVYHIQKLLYVNRVKIICIYILGAILLYF